MIGPLQFMDSFLRLYGHPRLLAVAEQLNGPDFVPFRRRAVGQGGGAGAVDRLASGRHHPLGRTRRRTPAPTGFNFMAQLYPTTPENGLWLIPGSHCQGKIDIKARIAANGGSDRLPGAVPMVCQPGDIALVNRQILHGAFRQPLRRPPGVAHVRLPPPRQHRRRARRGAGTLRRRAHPPPRPGHRAGHRRPKAASSQTNRASSTSRSPPRPTPTAGATPPAPRYCPTTSSTISASDPRPIPAGIPGVQPRLPSCNAAWAPVPRPMLVGLYVTHPHAFADTVLEIVSREPVRQPYHHALPCAAQG